MTSIRITTASAHPPLSKKDAAYVESNYVSVEELCLGRAVTPHLVYGAMLNKQLPLPSYVIGERLMVPVDYLVLYEDAGSLHKVRETFERRLINAQQEIGLSDDQDVEAVWNDYLSGEFGICLWCVTPESIVAKGLAMTNIARLVAKPSPEDPVWAELLRIWVKRLDLIERPFADADEARFGARTSRARYIDDMKLTYPEVFVSVEEPSCHVA